MPLPVITSPNPTTAPAVAAMTFADSFLTSLHFIAQSPTTPWTVRITTRNYDAATGTLAPPTPENSNMVAIPVVQTYAGEYPLLAQTLATVLVVAGLMQTLDAAKKSLAAAHSLLDTDTAKASKVSAATAAVAAARIALGAS